jgi:hypothetical protein
MKNSTMGRRRHLKSAGWALLKLLLKYKCRIYVLKCAF